MSRERREQRQASRQKPDTQPIPVRYQHYAAIAVIVASLIFFFRDPIFKSEVFLAVDNIASHSFDTFLQEARQEGVFPLWNPYVFCGMPSYGSLMTGGERIFDISGTLYGYLRSAGSALLLNQTVGWVILYYMIFGIGMYLFAWRRLGSRIAALTTSMGAVFSTFIITWIMAGHNTKIGVIAMFPFLFILIENLRERFTFVRALLLVLVLHLSFLPSHVQMIFYMYLAVGIYVLYFLIRHLLRREDWKGIVRAGAVFAAASVLAFGMDSDKYLSTLEYNPYSIRGKGPILETASQNVATKSAEGGLSYDYATSWSLGVGEVMTFFVPSLYGFGSHTYEGNLTNGQVVQVNTYFGPQPFTEAPLYMGIVILILAFYGFVRNRKDPFVQFMGITIVFSLLVAFGKEMSIVYDLMYNYFPAFNKFRIPVMILVLMQIFIPFLAGYAIRDIMADRNKGVSPLVEKRWRYTAAGLGALTFLSFIAPGLFGSIYQSFFPADETTRALASRFGNMQVAAGLYTFVTDTVVNDIQFALLFLTLAAGASYLYIRRMTGIIPFSVVLVGVAVIDLWRIDVRPMETQEPRRQQAQFIAPEYVNFLKRDSTLFRVLQFEGGQPPYSNKLAYWKIQSAYGYHGAKMRTYQDLVDVAGMKNPLLWQLMNVKYIITDQPDSTSFLGLVYNNMNERVYINSAMLPRAFFVNRYAVAEPLEVIRAIAQRSFNPRDLVYLNEDPNVAVDPPGPGSTVSIREYEIQQMTIDVATTGTNILFLSESYYPKGWKAFIGDEELHIYRANYHFRALIVPPGVHQIEMFFEPTGFYLGRQVSLIINILILLGFGYVGWSSWKQRQRETKTSTAVAEKE